MIPDTPYHKYMKHLLDLDHEKFLVKYEDYLNVVEQWLPLNHKYFCEFDCGAAHTSRAMAKRFWWQEDLLFVCVAYDNAFLELAKIGFQDSRAIFKTHIGNEYRVSTSTFGMIHSCLALNRFNIDECQRIINTQKQMSKRLVHCVVITDDQPLSIWESLSPDIIVGLDKKYALIWSQT